MSYQVELSRAATFLKKTIKGHASAKELDWVDRQENILRNNFELRSFYLAFSTAARFIEKRIVQLTQKEKTEADSLRIGFCPEDWNLLQLVRTYLLLLLPEEDVSVYESRLTKLHETADVDEQVTLYSALPLLPFPDVLTKRAAEGIRTNITAVFDAIALNNPYPADFLNQAAWNQMVLKAVFMQRPLYRIYGADERANSELAEMLIDFAHERWAANRKVLPELWRFVGPFLNKEYLPDMTKAIEGKPLERQAALLACFQSKLPEAQQLLDQYPETREDIERGRLNWTLIGKESENDA